MAISKKTKERPSPISRNAKLKCLTCYTPIDYETYERHYRMTCGRCEARLQRQEHIN